MTVTFEPRYGAKVYRAVADATDGAFEIQLDPNYSRKSYTVAVRGSEGGPVAVAKNVMFGDVFFCSGQSNMDFPVKVAYNSTMEMQSLKVRLIKFGGCQVALLTRPSTFPRTLCSKIFASS